MMRMARLNALPSAIPRIGRDVFYTPRQIPQKKRTSIGPSNMLGCDIHSLTLTPGA